MDDDDDSDSAEENKASNTKKGLSKPISGDEILSDVKPAEAEAVLDEEVEEIL